MEKGNLYGLADVFSIAAALHDWDMAIAQDPAVRNAEIYGKASAIVDARFLHIESDRLDVRTVFNLIVNSAYITGVRYSIVNAQLYNLRNWTFSSDLSDAVIEKLFARQEL